MFIEKKYKQLNTKWKSQKKAEIEARKYEVLQLQLSLAKANDESSQSSSKYVTLDKVCESIPEKVERWRQSTSVGNQSTIKSSGTEANVYGVQIYRADGRNGNEFEDGLREK
jgi:hypothetical protein